MKMRKDLKTMMIKREKDRAAYMLNISFLYFLNQKQYIYGLFQK